MTGLIFLGGCQTAYYNTMEKFGYHKRDIMVQRVQDARDAQQEAKEQFASALDAFSKTLNFQGGELEEKYETLKTAFDASEEKANEVRDRIEAVESVSEALFDEWREELEQYSNPDLRKASKRQFEHTKQQYRQLINAMRRAEKKIDPVLSAFKDQVLFLKHNLNAQAIASLQSELVIIENDVARLIREMEKSIEEANSFIENMQSLRGTDSMLSRIIVKSPQYPPALNAASTEPQPQ
jgi:hypothetical protein